MEGRREGEVGRANALLRGRGLFVRIEAGPDIVNCYCQLANPFVTARPVAARAGHTEARRGI